MTTTTTHCHQIQPLLSEYHEGALSVPQRQVIARHLATCQECAEYDHALQSTVTLLRSLPTPEPRLDLWPEFAARMDAVEAERRQSVVARMQTGWQNAVGRLAEGLVIYTQALAQRTFTAMERHLVQDPFRAVE